MIDLLDAEQYRPGADRHMAEKINEIAIYINSKDSANNKDGIVNDSPISRNGLRISSD